MGDPSTCHRICGSFPYMRSPPLATPRFSEAPWTPSYKTRLHQNFELLVQRVFGQTQFLSDRRTVASITSQHTFKQRCTTCTANLQRPTIPQHISVLPPIGELLCLVQPYLRDADAWVRRSIQFAQLPHTMLGNTPGKVTLTSGYKDHDRSIDIPLDAQLLRCQQTTCIPVSISYGQSCSSPLTSKRPVRSSSSRGP